MVNQPVIPVISEQLQLDTDERAVLGLIAEYADTANQELRDRLDKHLDQGYVTDRAKRIGRVLLDIPQPAATTAEKSVADWYRNVTKQNRKTERLLEEAWERRR